MESPRSCSLRMSTFHLHVSLKSRLFQAGVLLTSLILCLLTYSLLWAAAETLPLPAPETTVSRADFSVQLLKALGYPTDFVSEFPFFRDVPRDHPAYVSIETLRERGFVSGLTGGFFKPEQPISNLDAYMAISSVMATVRLPKPTVETLLAAYKDKQDIPQRAQEPVARLVHEDILHVEQGKENFLKPEAPLTQDVLDTLLGRLGLQMQSTPLVSDRTNESLLPAVPAGLRVAVTPSSALVRDNLSAGDEVYFVTIEDSRAVSQAESQKESIDESKPVDILTPQAPLPTTATPESETGLSRGTRLRANIIETRPDGTMTLRFSQAVTPVGTYYKLNALLPINFPKDADKAFVVPGQRFELLTLPSDS